jgi:hypothetical protein
MLASITPLGERGRGGHWAVTITAFVIGATVAGMLVGATAGWIGGAVLGTPQGPGGRLGILAVAAVLAIGLDSRRESVPGPRRQVDERWLDRFRGWVYGLGYGAQLGAGLTTVVSSAATYLALLASLLTGAPMKGAAVMGLYGAIRGISPLLAARVRSPQELMALHSRLDRARVPARGSGLVLMTVVVAAAAAGAVG